MKLTPRQEQALDAYVDGVTFSSWGNLAKLFQVSIPATRDEKIKLVRHIYGAWEARNEKV